MLSTATEQEIMQRKLAHLLVNTFNLVTVEDILTVKAPNVWYHKGVKLQESQVRALRSEAEKFSNSGLWNILKAELLWHAFDRGYRKSQTEADQVAAKLLEYLVQQIDDRLKKMIEK